MSDVKFGICGDLDWHNTPEKDDPFPTLEKEEIKEFITRSNRDPMEKEKVFSDYADLKDDIEKLLDLEFLKEKGGKIYVDFTFLDEEDNEFLLKVCEDYAKDLVKEISSKTEFIEKTLSRYENKRVEKEKLAFFILGCYFLDWGSLEFFRRWDIADNLKPQPGGNEYILWGEIQKGDMLKEIYWGGHQLPDTDQIFHTFGDHHPDTKRTTLPDILHHFSDFDFPGGDEYRSLLFDKRKELTFEFGKIIDEIGKEGIHKEEIEKKELVEELDKYISFLKEIKYIEEENGTYHLTIPYFTEENTEMISDCIEPFIPVLKDWLDENLGSLKEELKETRPMKNGVPFDELFIQVWHFIFGLTNKNLAREGIIYDTYSDRSDHKGYLPAVAEKKVLEDLSDSLTEEG